MIKIEEKPKCNNRAETWAELFKILFKKLISFKGLLLIITLVVIGNILYKSPEEKVKDANKKYDNALNVSVYNGLDYDQNCTIAWKSTEQIVQTQQCKD